MKRVLSIIIAVTILVLNCSAEVIASPAGNVIQNNKAGIPDRGLYQAILRELGKNKNAKFTKNEAEKITELDATNYDNKYTNIKSLKGIEYLSGLTRLYISGNKITSLAGIENLTDLVVIEASDNHLKYIKEVKNLTKLESLSVDQNKITSLSGIENLTELTALVASKNKLTKLPDLSKLKNLITEHTYFQFNNIKGKEFKKKIHKNLLEQSTWLESQIKFQNLTTTIKLTSPKSFKKITKNTTRISGKTQKRARVVIKTCSGKVIQKVKANSKGKFTLKKLNLKKYRGKKLVLETSLYNELYREVWPIKTVKFTVRKK